MTNVSELDLIRNSALFDAGWYLRQYPDTAWANLTPEEHYLHVGAQLMRDPGPNFSTQDYLNVHPDVLTAGINPLLHYEISGHREGRAISASQISTVSDYALIIHAYHPNTFAELRMQLAHFTPNVDCYVSYPRDSEAHSEEMIRDAFPGCVPIAVDNKGQDVGAFIQVVSQLDQAYRFYCKIHSKGGDKLPDVWRKALIQGTVGSAERVAQFERLFRENPDVMLGGPKELFLHGPSYLMGNTQHMDGILNRLSLKFAYSAQDWGFFAGTFFWIRAEVVTKLLEGIDTTAFLETGVRRDGQLAHAVERMFGILPASMGAKIALADCADLEAPVSVFNKFPEDAPREKRHMVETLRVIQDRELRLNVQRQINGEAPGLGFTRINNPTEQAQKPQRDFTIITPTGDRFAAFNRCVQMVNSQTVQPKEWIIVDDGSIPMSEMMRLPDWATCVRRERKSDDPPHTLSVNVLEALKHVTTDRVVIVEDDDYYSPLYVEYLLSFLSEHDMVGLNTIRYYHLLESNWKHGRPPQHTAFAQTAFNRGPAWDHLEKICLSNTSNIREKGIVDRYWWQTFEGRKLLIKDHPALHVGLKGGFGRMGLAEGHKVDDPDYNKDSKHAYLPQAMGKESFYYNRWQKKFRKPFAIYTAVAGGYDNLKEPLAKQHNFDFYAFSDTELAPASPWENVPFDEHSDDPVRSAKKPKIMPHLYFPDYEWSLWIDANLFMLEDLDVFINAAIENRSPLALFEHPERNTLNGEVAQLCKLRRDDPNKIQSQFEGYKADGWDNQLPLYECNFIVRRHNDPTVSRAMTMWWNEICTNSRRDQVSFPYTMWKSGITPMSLRPKGNSTRNIPEIFYPTSPPHGDIQLESVIEAVDAHRAKNG